MLSIPLPLLGVFGNSPVITVDFDHQPILRWIRCTVVWATTGGYIIYYCALVILIEWLAAEHAIKLDTLRMRKVNLNKN